MITGAHTIIWSPAADEVSPSAAKRASRSWIPRAERPRPSWTL